MDTTSSSVKKGPILIIMILGAFLATLNQTVMSVATPELMIDFNISATTAQWLTTGYMLVNGILIPITAYFMQRFSTRQLFQASMMIFLVGTIVSALAVNFPVLLTGRMIQAAGAGIIMPLLTNVILVLFPPEKRGAAMGMMGLAIIFAPAIGPTLAGYILENFKWQTMFYGMIPLAVIVIICGFIYLKNVSETVRSKMDIISVVLSTVAFGTLLYGFSQAGSQGWSSAEVLVSIAVGVIALGLFVWRQLVSKKPLLDLRAFKYNMFSLTTTAGLNQLPARLNAHGTAISNTVRQVAGAVGTSLLVTVMSDRTKTHLTDMMESGGAAANQKQMVLEATIQGINDAYVVIIGIGIVGLLLSFFIKRTSRNIEHPSEAAIQKGVFKPGGSIMQKEIISLAKITQFRSAVEEFSPFEWYRHHLEHDPISYSEETNSWNVFRYEDVKRVLSDYEYFSSVRARTTISVGADNEAGQHNSGRVDLSSDPPEHRKSRSLLSAAFTPRSLKLWEPRIHEVVSQLIKDMGDEPVIDIVKSFSSALPTIVIADLLGVPSEDRFLFKEWVDHLFLPLPADNVEDVQELKRQDDHIYGEVQANRELLPNTVEEMLRYRFHMAKMDRTVKQDNNVLGVELKKGDVVVAWMSAANMDKEVFEDPFTLNIHRSNNKRHLTFGNGPHFCLGAPLARLEANIGLGLFMDQFERIEPVPGFKLEDHLTPSAAGQTLISLPRQNAWTFVR
ncbi:hypothetical protein BGX30_001314 [Mortierella sp. GBA39]|nr:hypothetical protein BGX30_001314 [Mortierella sp. GBA39]